MCSGVRGRRPGERVLQAPNSSISSPTHLVEKRARRTDVGTGFFCSWCAGKVCDQGRFANSEHTECFICGAGHACSGGLRIKCQNGTFSEGRTSDICTYVGSKHEVLFSPEGSRVGEQLCGPGTYSEGGVDHCTACPEGTHSAGGRSACVFTSAKYKTLFSTDGLLRIGQELCPPGTYSEGGRDVCVLCESGTYSEGGRTACTEVRAGSQVLFSEDSMQRRIDEVPCKGESVSNSGMDACVLCPEGKEAHSSKTRCITLDGFLSDDDEAEGMPLAYVVKGSAVLTSSFNATSEAAVAEIKRAIISVAGVGYITEINVIAQEGDHRHRRKMSDAGQNGSSTSNNPTRYHVDYMIELEADNKAVDALLTDLKDVAPFAAALTKELRRRGGVFENDAELTVTPASSVTAEPVPQTGSGLSSSKSLLDTSPTTMCSVGYYCTKGQEIPCGAGFYSTELGSTTKDSCKPCPVDTYSKFEGSTKCTSCPDGKNTNNQEGSDNESSCVVLSTSALISVIVVPLVILIAAIVGFAYWNRRRLLRQLQNQGLENKLKQRVPFVAEEFDSAYAEMIADGDEDGRVGLVAVLFDCVEYCLASKDDDQTHITEEKWSYFNIYLKPLLIFEEEKYWERLKVCAKKKSRKLEEKVKEIVARMDGDGEDGNWVANTLENVKGKLSHADGGSCWVDEQILNGGKSLPPHEKHAYDAEVLPNWLRCLAGVSFAAFGDALINALPDGTIIESEKRKASRVPRAVLMTTTTQILMKMNWEELDRDRNGFLTTKECVAALQKSGMTATNTHELADFIASLDLNSDGKVRREEFETAVKQLQDIQNAPVAEGAATNYDLQEQAAAANEGNDGAMNREAGLEMQSLVPEKENATTSTERVKIAIDSGLDDVDNNVESGEDDGSHRSNSPLMLRYIKYKCVKKVKRMTAKVIQAQEDGEQFPAVSTIGDSLRASVCAPTMSGVRASWEALSKHVNVIRLKNKFRDSARQVRENEALSSFPNLHLNVLFKAPGCAPIVAEVQIHLMDILEHQKESHKVYEIIRANSVKEIK